MSSSTIDSTNSLNFTFGFHPSSFFALLKFAINRSTSAGLINFLSISMNFL